MIVTVLDMLRNQESEVVPDDGVYHVYNPLSWQALDVSFIWQILPDLLDLLSLGKDTFNRETLVHWNM